MDSQPNRTSVPSKDGKIVLSRGLYLVSTPIGNATDITLRGIEILTAADTIACEDTRKTRPFLVRHGIFSQGGGSRLVTYHEHNAARVRPNLIKAMQNGAVVALVSDAGTPAISDPGYKLVRECINAGIPITGAPGPTSVIAGLVISGLPTDQFFFRGFLPTKKAARRQIIKALRPVPGTLIFMESPRRLAAALNDLSDILGDRSAAVGRELTKLYEEVRRGTIAELRDHYGAAPPPKGEVLVMVGPGESGEMLTLADLEPEIIGRLRSESARDIARDLASESGISRREVYRWVVEIAKHLGQDG